MPVKFSINFKLKLSNQPKVSSLITPDHLHGFFFSLLPKDLAEVLHKSTRYKPFCLWAPQIFKFYQTSEEKTSEENLQPLDNFSLTISFLKDELFPPFLSHLFGLFSQKNNFKLFLGPYKVKLFQDVDFSLLKHDEYLSYDEPNNFTLKPLLSFRFLTPVSLKKGDVDYPLPDPKIVFKSILKKWNYFSPVKVSIDLRPAFEEKLYVVFASIKTYKIKLSLGSAVTGFIGKVVYGGKNLTEEELKWLTILGNFSNFAGVGRKTTMGLGMTRFEPIDREGEK